jgi:hypothetical protein
MDQEQLKFRITFLKYSIERKYEELEKIKKELTDHENTLKNLLNKSEPELLIDSCGPIWN